MCDLFCELECGMKFANKINEFIHFNTEYNAVPRQSSIYKTEFMKWLNINAVDDLKSMLGILDIGW